MTIRFNDGWCFAELPLDTPLCDAQRASFQPVDLPHDALIGNVSALYAEGDRWYRRTLTRPAAPRVFLRFDGAYMDSTLFVNGAQAFEWKYGYTTFEAELTDFLREGENELLLRVRYQSPNTRWYSGAGIFRDVWLKTSERARFASDGIYASAKPEGEGWTLTVSAETENAGDAEVCHRLLDERGAVVAASDGGAEQTLAVAGVRRWSMESPALYTLVSTLLVDGRAVDEQRARVGFREATFDPDRGFLLNGEPRKLNGVCMHHDLGALGAAFQRAALRRQMKLLLSMGVNAIRTSHNPPAPYLLDLCDELGVVVLDEAFDMWERPKTTYDYARFFPEWHERDVAAWVRRDRNHPCVVAWSIGNEIYDTHADGRGLELTRELGALARSHDPRHNASITSGSNYMTWENAQRCADALEAVGYNYTERLYAKHHAEHPTWAIYGSETSSTLQSRGVYHFPLRQPLLADDDLQCSSLGNSGASWGAKSLDACLSDDRNAPFSAGTFLWTGFDYIGEPTPYQTKNSYFGMIDTAGFPKDAYYVCQAYWTNEPMVHLYPHWDWNEGQPVDVRVCSNQPRVRLTLNGRLIGEQALDHLHGRTVHADFVIPYEKGELKAEALDASGTVVATDVQRSFGDAAKLVLAADRLRFRADGEDMAFLTISAADAQGVSVANANNRVRVRVEGAARLVGMDNGDSADTDEYKTDNRRMFNGMLLAMLMARTEPGEVRVTVESEGLESASLTLTAEPAEREPGVSAQMEVASAPMKPEVPVRRVDLRSPQGTALSQALPEVTVEALLLPANASYREVEWRAANDTGVTTNLALVRADGLTATVRALGDGAFWLRCVTRNGGDTPTTISMLHFTAEGFGGATLDPYAFISASLYTVHDGQIASGNDRGVSIPPAGQGMFGFERVDFGAYGSDELTVPVFALDAGLHHIQIWDGVPGQGGELLLDAPYQKPSRWNVYQEETWVLPRRLVGLRTLCFASADRLHIKGFVFKRLERAWATLPAGEADAIYGDRFVHEGTRVTEIGNNVTLRFDDMDFGEGARRLILCGYSPIDRNTLHVRFTDDAGEERVQMVEFDRSNGYEERAFDVSGFSGRGQLSFVFLPGSNFHFDWFRFEQ